MSLPKATLYTRRNCCLCDKAKQLLSSVGLEIEEIDIDADPLVRERYNDCIPVVVIDGRERFRGRVEPLLLRRIVAQSTAE